MATINTDKAYEIAYLYVNSCGRSPLRTMRAYAERHPEDNVVLDKTSAWCRIQNETVQKYIKEFEEENKEQLRELRDINIATLKDIAFSVDSKKTERITAIKELNNMCGYNQTNINASVDAQIEVVIE